MIALSKHLEVFFKTENDAESAKAELQKLKISNELVEPIPEDTDLKPIVPMAGSSNTGGGTFSFTDVLEPKYDKEGALSDKRHLTYVLHCKVQEEEYEQAIKIIKNHDGHMDQSKL